MPKRDAELSRRVAGRFAQVRRANGWSMDRLADEAGLHRTSVGLIERGLRSMSLEVADRLARSLGLDLAVVIADVQRGDEDPTNG